ncbi:winged helix DNA-binding protein [Saccharothrix carnea]|uniref:Winged helix DNA-binding protein n=1 Tax=Saccharothrix carnea TaxID=1280637 RepID=A0A2P8IHI5_SACCR|nr:winged helix DNA-binding protein [Saccharothrix carnea]
MSVTWRQVAAWRTRRHGLDVRRPAGEALEVVSRLCGLHAQLMSSAGATLRARVDGLPDDAVEQALWTDRALVKTWSMRGTLHLLPAAEYPLWQAGFATYRHYRPTGCGRGTSKVCARRNRCGPRDCCPRSTSTSSRQHATPPTFSMVGRPKWCTDRRDGCPRYSW